VSKNKQPWDLINWIKKCKLPTIETLQFNRCLCIELEDLWQAFYLTFNSAQNQHINSQLLNKISSKLLSKWLLFSKAEFNDAINKCSSLSTSGPNHISWHHCNVKILVANNKCITNLVNIANTCINLSFWPLHFKKFTSIIIPKPNKVSYNFLKTFCSIVLLNILKKLIEKVFSEILQVQFISSNFIHLNQLGGLKHCSTTDASVYLTHLICTGWINDLHTSILAFNIT